MAADTPGTGRSWVLGPPVLIELTGTKSAKRKPRLDDADQMERNLYRASRRTAKAADKGLRRYDKSRRKSARRERDGAVIDLMPNMAKGMAASAGTLAALPIDLMRAGSPRSVRRIARRSTRSAARALR